MTDHDSGDHRANLDQPPDYQEMADKLRAVGEDLLRRAENDASDDMVEKAKRIINLADQIRPKTKS